MSRVLLRACREVTFSFEVEAEGMVSHTFCPIPAIGKERKNVSNSLIFFFFVAESSMVT